MSLLTRKEAASWLRVSLRKLDALAAEGSLRFLKIGPGKKARVLYREEDLEEFVAQHLSMTDESICMRAGEVLKGIR